MVHSYQSNIGNKLYGRNPKFKKFITSFSTIVALLHVVSTHGNRFQWEKIKKKSFEDLKEKLSQALVMTMPNFQQPFEIEIVASVHAMGIVHM